MTDGLFIVFEGGEGAGKTTQIKALASALTNRGHDVVLTREPGASPLGMHIRRLLLDPDMEAPDHRTEALLFAADRAEHVARIIRPALAAGQTVISDRYMDSSAAYQGVGRGLSRTEIRDLSLWATDALLPDLTFVLDIDPRVGIARASTSEFGVADRFESEEIEFAAAVRSGFLALAAEDPSRYVVIDAAGTPELVAAQVLAALLDATAHRAA